MSDDFKPMLRGPQDGSWIKAPLQRQDADSQASQSAADAVYDQRQTLSDAEQGGDVQRDPTQQRDSDHQDSVQEDTELNDSLRMLEQWKNDTPQSIGSETLTERDLDHGLAKLDPLTVHPRLSSRVLCVVFAFLMLALSAGLWWLAVRTMDGQSYEDIVFSQLRKSLPAWFDPILSMFTSSQTVIAISLGLGAIALVVMIVRKRWWLIGQSVVLAALCFAARFLKYVLPRPVIIKTESFVENSAPSGHTLLAGAASVTLLLAVPRAWRALAAVITGTYTMCIAISLIAGRWHRPVDVIMSILIVGAVALLVLACTRASGMDDPGKRVSSASVQIVSSVLLSAGILGCAYGAYIIWQVEPGLSLSARWANSGIMTSTVVLICAVTSMVFGLVLAMRQLTASPLTKLGLVGAPPAPPRR